MVNDMTEMATSTYGRTPAAHERTTSEAVVEAIAEAEGIPASEVRPPLYEAIDPDALDDLFAARSLRTDRSDGYVVFPYCGHEVTVYGNGEVKLSEQHGSG